MTDLDKAREWAERWSEDDPLILADAKAAIKLIKELPDKWVGAEEVREIADDLESLAQESVLKNRFVEQVRRLRNLIAPTLPKPEDVPANEPWLIEVDGEKAIGTRYEGNSVVPWSVASLDGSFAGDYNDSEVTLIHKLVAEPPALPEGMRLADHKTYGRVVVAPRANTHGEESFYRTNEDISWGASHGYRPTGEFNFLDGDQHV